MTPVVLQDCAVDSPSGGLLRKSIHYFGHQLRPFWKLLLLGWFCMIAIALLQLIKPWPIKMVFDGLLVPVKHLWIYDYAPRLADRPDLLLATIALSIFGIATLVALFGFGHSYIFKSVGQRVLAAIRSQFYAHVQRLPHSFHDVNQSADLLLRLTGDIRTLREILVSSIVFITERGLFMLGMLVSLMEALSSAVPVVATTVGGVAEMIQSGVNGFTVPIDNPEAVADAVAKIIANPEMASRMSKAA